MAVMLYKKVDDTVKSDVFPDDADFKALKKDGWADSPAGAEKPARKPKRVETDGLD